MTDMSVKPILHPGPSHPISVQPSGSRIVVTVGGQVVADTIDAVSLQEAAYPAVHYIPLKDVNVALLERTDHTSYCPYKGDASYYSIPAGGDRSVNAIWTYEAPFVPVAAIKDHLAFYPDRVDSITVEAIA